MSILTKYISYKNRFINIYNKVLLEIYKRLYIGTAYIPPKRYNTFIYEEVLKNHYNYNYTLGDDIEKVAYNAGKAAILNVIRTKYLDKPESNLNDFIKDLKQ